MSFMQEIRIGERLVGSNYPPLIIAEMSGNHRHSIDRALEIIDAAHAAGCHALKLQTYTADTMTIETHRNEFLVSDKNSLWRGRTLYDLYQEAHTPWEWHQRLFARCAELGMIAFSTPFDETAVDFLEELNVPAYKIASFENAHLPLIKKVARTGKPVIISTGMASVSDLEEAVSAVLESGNRQLILLKCTSAYPSAPEDCNISTIPHMSQLFGVPVGLSDHTPGIGVSVASVAFGAVIIEKHFTVRRSDGGPDADFSLEPLEMKALVEESKRAYLSIGRVSYSISEREKSSLIFRRSLFAIQDIRVGEPLSKNNIRIIRPGYGMAPKHYDAVLKMRARVDIARGTPLNWSLLE